MKLNIKRNYHLVSYDHKELLDRSIDRMEIVLVHDAFKDALYDLISKSNELEGELSEWKNKTVKEIYEVLFDSKDGDFCSITLEIFTYYTAANVIGYGTAANKNIYVNRKYLNTYEPGNLFDLRAVGSNLLHEHGHDCGFDHDFDSTRRRPNSIAYILGKAYQIAYSQIYNIEYKEKVLYVPWYKRFLQWFK